MTPKEKANDLIHNFFSNALPDAVECDLNVGKQCALIAVEEIIECAGNGLGTTKFSKEYWQQVKYELQSL
jgi:hypothetical protein